MNAIDVMIVALLPWVSGIVWLVARGGWSVLVPAPGERVWSAGVRPSSRR
jgi:hypothetical protein